MRAQELAQEINVSDEWNVKALTELCHLAGMAVEWYEAANALRALHMRPLGGWEWNFKRRN